VKIQQLTIIGTGLIGGSFGLALRRSGFGGGIVGCDRPQVLARARRLGAIDRGAEDPARAAAGSQLVFLATPVGRIIDLIERLGPALPRETFFTDAGSTKLEIVRRAQAVFGERAQARFLGGHPMAGSDQGGIDHAQADLFRDAAWLLTPLPTQDLKRGLPAEFLKLLRKVGARPLSIDAQRHDRLCAWISHLPQMLSTALASVLEEEFEALGNQPDVSEVGGRALRDMTRIASSPYSLWRDIALTNQANTDQALSRLEQKLARIRENLRTRALEQEFAQARKFARRLSR